MTRGFSSISTAMQETSAGVVDREKLETLFGDFAKRRRREHDGILHRWIFPHELMYAFKPSSRTAFYLNGLNTAIRCNHEIDLRLRILGVTLPPVRFVAAKSGRKFLRDKLFRQRAVIGVEEVMLRVFLLFGGDFPRVFLLLRP